MRRWSIRVAVAVLMGMILAVSVGPTGRLGPTVAGAAAPPPPIPECVADGSFNIADRCSIELMPSTGWQFGGITSVVAQTTTLGDEVTFSYPVSPAKPLGEPVRCGDLGCIAYGISWRAGLNAWHETLDGCTPTSLTCTVRYWGFSRVGDDAERYGVMYAELYLGRTPQNIGTAFLTYAPSDIYPVRLDPVDSSGARTRLPSDFVAYAIAPGRNPVQADCVDAFWYTAHVREAEAPVPDCVTLRWDGYLDGSDNWFGGWLPDGSGTWTVVGAPAGDPALPLVERRSPYRQTTVTPAGDDIHGTIVAQRRPGLSLLVSPATTEMALGSRQVVEITVAADGGETGWLEGLRFEDPAILRVEPSGVTAGDNGSALAAGAPDDLPPAEGFRLEPGQERRFRVELEATALGRADVRAFVSGRDDLGIALAVDQGGPILVSEDGPEGDGAAPRPPVVTEAIDAGAGAGDSVAGTVDGAPGTTVIVDVVAGTPVSDDECLRQMQGAGATPLGLVEVTIGEEGTGAFSLSGALEPGQDVYGTTTIGAVVSAVGPCTPVEAADPGAEAVDLRGEWRMQDATGAPFGRLEITKHDQATGKVTGTARGEGVTLKVAGTLKGSRLTLTFSQPGYRTTGAGKLERKGGQTTVLLRSSDGKDVARLTLVKPRG
jgi:hypothetical protein